MRVTGPLTLTLNDPPRLAFYESRAYGGFAAFDIFELRDGARDPGAEVTLFAPIDCGPRLRRAVAAFNAAMAAEDDRPAAEPASTARAG